MLQQTLPAGNRSGRPFSSQRITTQENKRRKSAALAALSAAVLAGTAGLARAADISWDGGGANDSWTNGINWGTNVAPLPLDNLFFDGAVRTTPINDFTAGTQFGSITFNAGASAFTLGGNSILLGAALNPFLTPVTGQTVSVPQAAGISNLSPNLQTVTQGLTLSMFTHSFSGGTGGLALNPTGGLARQAGAAMTFSGPISTTTITNAANGIIGGFATVGNDWATVSGGNIVAYTGYTDVTGAPAIANGPTTNVRWSASSGNATVGAGVTDINTLLFTEAVTRTLTMTAGSTLRLGPAGAIAKTDSSGNNPLTVGVGGSTLTAGGAPNTPGQLVLLGNAITPDINGLVVASNITDNGTGAVTVIKTGNAAVQLNSAGSYSGGSYVNSGRLRANAVGAFGTGPIFVANGAQAYFSAAGTYNNAITLSGFGFLEGAAPQFSGGAMRLAAANVVITGPVTLAGDARIGARGTTATTFAQITGQISGNFSLEFGGTNTASSLQITNPANNWGGNTTVSLGRLMVGANEVIPNGAGKGNLTINGETNGSAPSSILDVNGKTETINGLNSSGDLSKVVINTGVAGPATLIIGDNNANGNYAGAIQNGSGTIAITKIGSGSQGFSGNLSYGGNTNIQGGTLALSGSSNLNSSRNINIGSGARLDVSAIGGHTIQSGQTVSGSGTIAGKLTMTDANATLAPGGIGVAGTLALTGDFDLGNGNLRSDLASTPAGTSDVVAVAGALNFSGQTTLALNRLTGSVAAGTYTIMTYGSTTGTPNFTFPKVRQSLTGFVDSGSVRVSIGSGAPSNLTWVGDGAGNAWEVLGAANFSGGAGGDNRFYDWDSVTFSDTGSNSPNIQVNGTLQPTTVTLSNTTAHPYQFDGGGLMLNADLVKTGNGVATLNTGGTNQFNNMTVSAGTLALQNNNTIATLTINGGVVEIRNSNTSIGGGTINSTGQLTVIAGNNPNLTGLTANSGGQILVLGSPTFGSTTIASGATLTIGNGVDGGQGDPQGSVANNGLVLLNRPDDYNVNLSFTGTGALRKQGNGVATLGLASSYSGGTTISTGTLRVTNATGAGTGSITVPSSATLVISTSIANPLNSLGGGTIGVATVTLSGEATFATGTTTNFTLYDPANPGSVQGNATFSGVLHGGGTVSVTANPNLVTPGTLNVDGAGGFRPLGNAASDFSGTMKLNAGVKGEIAASAGGFDTLGTGKIIMTAGTFNSGATTGDFSLLNLRNLTAGDFVYGNNLEIVAGSGSFITLNPLDATAPAGNLQTLGNLKVGANLTVGVNKNGANPNVVGFQSVTLTGGATGPTIFAPNTPGYAATPGVANLLLNAIGESPAGASWVMNGNTQLILTGNHTYTGAATVSTGSLLLGRGTLGTSIASTAGITNNATVAFNSSTTVSVAGSITGTGTVLHLGSGNSSVAGRITGSALSVSAGNLKIGLKGTANSAAGTSVVKALSISTGASLDLTNNSMVVDYDTLGTLVDDTRANLKAGRLLTTAVSPANTRLGYLDNNTLATPKTSFGGVSVDPTSLLVKFTYSGDADLDGDADGVDIGTWATNFTGELGGGPTATHIWSQGDWDYDGDVDGVDAGLWATAFTGELGGNGLGSIVVNDPTISPQAASILQGMGITVVPEPATLGLLGLCLAGGLARRSRRR